MTITPRQLYDVAHLDFESLEDLRLARRDAGEAPGEDGVYINSELLNLFEAALVDAGLPPNASEDEVRALLTEHIAREEHHTLTQLAMPPGAWPGGLRFWYCTSDRRLKLISQEIGSTVVDLRDMAPLTRMFGGVLARWFSDR